MSKENDLKYIKEFSKITISGICKEIGVDRVNVLRGKASAKSTELVRQTIEEKLKQLDDPTNDLYNHIPRID